MTGWDGFTGEFDSTIAVGAKGNKAYFGRDVLSGLVDGIEDFVAVSEDRWRQFRSLGPVLIGSAMWINDQPLVDALGTLAGACIVVKKQPQGHHLIPSLRQVADDTPGIPITAFWQLTGMAPKVNGAPMLVGPWTPKDTTVVPAIRALGYRLPKQRHDLPILHAKLALLGSLWWHDEGPLGHVDDVIGFTPKRLWIGSANFTNQSRANLEFGFWTEENALLQGARQFLVSLIGASQPIDTPTDAYDPELAPVEFDDIAMAEAAAQYGWGAHEEDE